jgi:GAF domain-containing protein
MHFSAVARVTADRWVACLVEDHIAFGLDVGGELAVHTTICDEIRCSNEGVFIDHVAEEPMWRVHPTPILYGFQSYISMPIVRADGSFFGTLCAIDPEPREISLAPIVPAIIALAQRIADALDAESATVSAHRA